jgi:hypothetical protein
MIHLKKFLEQIEETEEVNDNSQLIDDVNSCIELLNKSMEKTKVKAFSVDLGEFIKICEAFVYALENKSHHLSNISDLVFESSVYCADRCLEFKHEETAKACIALSETAEDIVE